MPRAKTFEIDETVWSLRFPNCNVDPNKARKALLDVQRKAGELTDVAVVASAKSPANLLHPLFEWNNAKAANAHRLRTAQTIMRAVKIVYTERKDKVPVRAFEMIKKSSVRDKGTRTVYGTHEEAVSDPVARENLINEALRQLLAWRRRWYMLNEFDKMHLTIDSFEKEFVES